MSLQNQIAALTGGTLNCIVWADGYETREALKGALNGLGLRSAVFASSPTEVLDRFRYKRIDLCILSDTIPGGIPALVGSVRAHAQANASRCHFVAVCEGLTHATLLAVKQAGVADVLVKPFTAERLGKSVVAAVLG